MKRVDFLKTLAAGGAAYAAWGPHRLARAWAADGGSKPPNFVFILADDWGWGDLGCYGHPTIKTPNLDHLAGQGTRFTQYYVNGSVCSPSRAAIMTGHFPARHGIHAHFATHEQNAQRDMPNWLDPEVTTLPDLLKSAGYITGHFGKWHLGAGEGAPEPKEYGLDDYRTFNGNGPGWEGVADWIPRSSELIVDETLRFIGENRARPFFVQAWLKDTHAYLDPTEKQREPYKKLGGALEIYYGAATDADRQIGRILAKLDELGLAENTVVVFSSDNGPEDITITNASHSGVGSPGPFRGRKRSLYEGGVRVPLIVRWPGKVPAGRVDNASVVSGVDLLPTFCALAGVPDPESLRPDGEDVSAALLGRPFERRKPLFWEFRSAVVGHVINRSPMLALREGNWKLLMNPDRSRIELYDIPNEPSELNNLADRNPEVVERLAGQLLAWRSELPPGRVDKGAGVNVYPWPKEAH